MRSKALTTCARTLLSVEKSSSPRKYCQALFDLFSQLYHLPLLEYAVLKFTSERQVTDNWVTEKIEHTEHYVHSRKETRVQYFKTVQRHWAIWTTDEPRMLTLVDSNVPGCSA